LGEAVPGESSAQLGGILVSVDWLEIKSIAWLLLGFLVVGAAIGCLTRLKLIHHIIKEFNNARGPIWDLRKTISDLTELEPVIRQLAGQMALLDAKVDAARRQVAELQVESISGRTQEGDGSDLLPQEAGSASAEQAERNWELLREYWRRNTRRIEYVIDQIADGRTRLSYDRIPRTRYRRLVHKLQGAKLISAAAATASCELIDFFNSYRPKSRQVPNSVVGTLKLLDQQLDKELVDYAKVVAADADDLEERDDNAASAQPARDRSAGPPSPLPPGNGAEHPTN
jgi:hypothetical protein